MAIQSQRHWAALTLLGSVLITTITAFAAEPDHVHVAVEIVVPRDEASGAGDALGLYALQLLPCTGSAQSSTQAGALGRLQAHAQGVGERVLGLLVGTVHANHRERFDGPAAAEFGRRVALDRAATTHVGTLVAPLVRYCRVGLVLARLPSQGKEAALPFSLRLSKPFGQALIIDFRENLEIPLAKPWAAGGLTAKLTVVLRPRRALQVLNLQGIDDGERMQRAVFSLATDATASIDAR